MNSQSQGTTRTDAGGKPGAIRASLDSLTGVRRLAATAVMVSMIIAAAMGEIINRDGVIYVRTAQAFLDGGLAGAMPIYNWPAYPILFALVSKSTGLPLEAAAHVVNAGLILLLVDAFIRLCHELDRNSPRPWVAALVILSLPYLDHRLEIYRDWGYVAFALCAFVPLTRFWQAREGAASDAIAWQLAIFAAFLFRVEAAALIALAPLGLLFQRRPWRQRLCRYLLANALPALGLVAGAILIASGKLPLGKLQDFSMYLSVDFVAGEFNRAAQQIAEHALNKYSEDFAANILAGGVATMVVWMTLDNLGGLLIALTVAGIYRHRLPASEAFRLLYWLLAIVVLTLFVFLATKLIIVSRYALLGSLLVMAVTAYHAARFPGHRRGEAMSAKILRWITVAGLTMATLGNIIALPDYKGYIREAGHWMRDNVPTETPILSNDSTIEYYAARTPGPKLDYPDKLERAMLAATPPYYVALKLKGGEREAAMLQLVGTPPVKEFHSRRKNERVAIFLRPRPE